MLLFSPKAKRVIDYAVWTLPDDRKRRAWQSWAISHHIVRQAGDPTNDGRAPMPPDIAQIVLAALDRMATTLRRPYATISEDDAFVADNGLSYVQTLAEAVTQELRAERP
jgi:hypothetical protein